MKYQKTGHIQDQLMELLPNLLCNMTMTHLKVVMSKLQQTQQQTPSM